MVQRQHQDVGADPDPLGAGRDRRGGHERRGQHPLVGEVVLGQPHGLEPQPVGFADLDQALRVVAGERGGMAARTAQVVQDPERRTGHPIHLDVYAGVMSRTNIDIDDDAVEWVMKHYGLPTKREAVNFALRRMRRTPMTKDEALAMEGTGWDGDLDEIRNGFKPIEL
jgi:Arc/MetJ family transcription regulator